jgi:hypothetical protein
MRIGRFQLLLLATSASIPQAVLAAPCKFEILPVCSSYNGLHAPGPDRACFNKNLAIRNADPGIIPILPKPIVPKPIIPKPIIPRPIVPAPKPVDASPGLTCKRGAGEVCSNIPDFGDELVDGLKKKGITRQEDLIKAQKAETPSDVNTPVRDVASKYDVNTQERGVGSVPVSDSETTWLGQDGLAVVKRSDTWTQTRIKNKPEDKPRQGLEDLILKTQSDPHQGTMVILNSEGKRNDVLPGEPGVEKPSWSDMAMYSWRSTCAGANVNPDSLQYIFRNSIEKGDSATNTKKVIDAAIERTGGDRGKSNTFRGDPSANGITNDEIAGYQALAGTAHGAGVLRMLQDYPETMKNMRIGSFRVATDDTAGAGEEYHILIELVKVATP